MLRRANSATCVSGKSSPTTATMRTGEKKLAETEA